MIINGLPYKGCFILYYCYLYILRFSGGAENKTYKYKDFQDLQTMLLIKITPK